MLLRKLTFLYTWAIGLFVGMQFDCCCSQILGEAWSSLSEAPQNLQGERLS